MTSSAHGLAAALPTLLTAVADQAAQTAGFIRRRRQITGAGLVQSPVFGWMADPRAELEDLAAPRGVADPSLHQRSNARAVARLRLVLTEAMRYLCGARPETIPLLRRFTEVVLEDSTTVALPAGRAGASPGCGGSDPEAGRAGVKMRAQLAAITGAVRRREPAPALASDRSRRRPRPEPPPGSPRRADLGSFDLERMRRDTARGLHGISRVPARLTARQGDGPGRTIAAWLSQQGADRGDALGTLGRRERPDCRPVALRVPAELAEPRRRRRKERRKKEGRKLSAAQRVLGQWVVMVTDLVDAERVPAEGRWARYRGRWQVALLFKRWKSDGGRAASRGRPGGRVWCEYLAKQRAVLIKHWGTLLRAGPPGVVSAVRAGARVKWWASRPAGALGRGRPGAVEEVLERLKADLDRPPKRPRRKRPSTRQLLFAPRISLT
jgi:hypothetical protein